MGKIPKAPNIAGLFLRFLRTGDLLFRLVPDDQYGTFLFQDIQKQIEAGQSSLPSTSSRFLSLARKRVQHVGIYAGHGNVAEVQGWKGNVKLTDVMEAGEKGRKRYYDLMLRLPPRSKGQAVADKAEAVANAASPSGTYPKSHFGKISGFAKEAAADRNSGPVYADRETRLSDYDKTVGGRGSSPLYAYQIGPQLYKRMQDEARIQNINVTKRMQVG